MGNLVDSEITNFPENKGFADTKFHALKKLQQQVEDEWDRKIQRIDELATLGKSTKWFNPQSILKRDSVKNFVMKAPAAKIQKSPSKLRKPTEMEKKVALGVLPPELIRPEMVKLRRKKKKANWEDVSEYEDVPEEEEKNAPTLEQMQVEGYYRAL